MKEIAQRLVNAELGMLAKIEEYGQMSRNDARKVLKLYLKHKIVKLELGVGRYTVKHGAYLDRDTLRRALVEAEKGGK